MSTVLWNPTNEYMEYHHSGVRYSLNPGDKIKVPDRAANHLLTHLGNRGLTTLDFGDESKMDEIKEVALEKNKEFKKRQVMQYNILNQDRKMSGQPYAPPSKKVKEYAIELGIELLEPYTMKDMEKEKISDASRRVEEAENKAQQLEDKVNQLQDNLAKLLDYIESKEQSEEAAKRTAKKGK